jgi:hypothetical protein
VQKIASQRILNKMEEAIAAIESARLIADPETFTTYYDSKAMTLLHFKHSQFAVH